MTLFETIISSIFNATLTGMGVAIGSYLATEHLLKRIERKKEKKK